MLRWAEDVFIYCVALPQFSNGVLSGTGVVSGCFYNAHDTIVDLYFA